MSEEKSHQPTLVTFLLDCSNSAGKVRDNTISAFNSYLETLKSDGDEIEFTLIRFAGAGTDPAYVCEPVRNVAPLTRETYVPRGATPLIDATYQAIAAVDKSLQLRNDKPKIVICIHVGSLENSSTQQTWDELSVLVAEAIALGWQFIVLDAGPDASDQGSRMDLGPHRILRYDHRSAEKAELAFRLAAQNTVAFAKGNTADTIFDAQQMRDIGVTPPPVILSLPESRGPWQKVMVNFARIGPPVALVCGGAFAVLMLTLYLLGPNHDLTIVVIYALWVTAAVTPIVTVAAAYCRAFAPIREAHRSQRSAERSAA
jgi:hypothetical protein